MTDIATVPVGRKAAAQTARFPECRARPKKEA